MITLSGMCGPHLLVKHILEKLDISMHVLCNVVTHFLSGSHSVDSLCITYLQTLEILSLSFSAKLECDIYK